MKTRRAVNYVAVLVLSVGAILLGVGVHFLHAFQLKRNANALLEQADKAEQDGQPQQSLGLLREYLGLAPDNAQVLARYSLLAEQQAKTRRDFERAYELLEKVLRADAGHQEVRRHAARLAVNLRRYSDARYHLDILRKSAEDEVELLHLQARCDVGEAKFKEAFKVYFQAVEKEPFQVAIAMEYASLLRRHPEANELADEPDEVVERLLRAAPRSPTARLAAARYYAEFALWEKAALAVQVAIKELGAKDVDAFLLASQVSNALHKPQEARDYLEQGLKPHPDDLRLSQALARLDLQAGRPNDAWDKIKGAAKNLPTSPLETWSLGNLLIDLDKPDEVDAVINHLEGNKAKWGADALRARLQMRKGKWGEALALLDSARASHPPPAVGNQVELLLAACYERLGNPDQRLRAARRALADNPSSASRQAVASALAALGKNDEAIREYQLLVKEAPAARGELVRLLLLRNSRFAPAARQWLEVDEQLKQLPDDSSSRLLKAQVLAAQGKTDEARVQVEAERQRDPKQVAPWLFLLALAELKDDGKTVLPLLDEAERAAGRRPEWTLARASHVLRSAPAKAKDELKNLETALGAFQGVERDQLLRGLGRAFLLAGDPKSAARLWRELAKNQPGDAGVRFQLMELAFRAPVAETEQQAQELDQLVTEVRGIEGGDGILTRYGEAARLLLRMRANGRDKAALAAARRHLNEAEKMRPSWSAIPLLEAEAFELEGRPDQALEKYQAALDRGEERLAVVRRALALLAGQGRYAYAQALLSRLPRSTRSVGLLDRMGVELALLGPDAADPAAARRHALEVARKAIPADSKDYQDHLWLGQMCLLAGDKGEAEKAFRRALALADTTPQTWTVLILFLAQNDRKSDAEAELAAAKKKLPAKELSPMLGPCYEALGQVETAEKEYVNAASGRGEDALALRNLASFYTRTGQRGKAEPVLRKLMAARLKNAEVDAAWARRLLALVLALSGNYRRFQEAEVLVREQPDESLEDRKTRALVRATRLEHRREAIEDFEKLSSGRETVEPDVKFILAGLYEADGKWDLALRLLRSLEDDEKKNPYYQAYYVNALLRHKDVEEAERAFERFAKLDGPSLQKLALRVQVLQARAKTTEAVRLVQAYAQEKDARLASAAQLLDALGATAEAERLYRAYVSGSKEPASAIQLIAFLGRHERLNEALAQCELAWGTCPPEAVASASVALLRSPKASREQVRQVEQRLAAALSKQPKTLVFVQLMAELLDNSGQHDEAAALYRKVLAQEPRNAFASNNLAVILALQGISGDQALKLAQTALEEAGPNADMLDTRAIVYLQRNRPDLAIRDLQQAQIMVAQPAAYFHLAQAQQLAKDDAKAKEAFAKAIELGLKASALHPLERNAFEKMKKEYE